MPPRSDELLKPWKIAISAELAGKVEFVTTDPLTRRPKYGARKLLVESLLSWWLAREAGDPLPDLPTIEQLRSL